jgi:hypothetical protein
MAWFVFDMDETLGHLFTPFYMLCFFKTKESFGNNRKNLAPELAEPLGRAYARFVDRIAATEASDTPLGILRPGLLPVMARLAALKDQGIIRGVVIYSNNGHLPSVHFVRDLIHSAIGRQDLICDAVHLYHPGRKAERFTQYGRTYANKTWAVVKSILESGPCGATDVTPQNVYFVDDANHPDLQRVLKTKYIQPKPYKYKTPFSILVPYFQEALESVGLAENPGFGELMNYVGTSCGTSKPSSMDQLLSQMRVQTRTPDLPVPAPDELPELLSLYLDGLESMSNVANESTFGLNNTNLVNTSNSLNRIQTNLFTGGKRRKTSKKRNLRKNRTRWLRRQQ